MVITIEQWQMIQVKPMIKWKQKKIGFVKVELKKENRINQFKSNNEIEINALKQK